MSAVSDEMLGLADHLGALTDEQWNAPSLCDEWRVRDVVAHLTAGADGAFNVRAVIGGLLRYRFDYNRWVAVDGQTRGQREPATILSDFRAAATRGDDATGTAAVRALAHVVIHGQDICRPLGIRRDLPDSHLIQVADFAASSIIFRAKKRISGVRLAATDLEWSHGAGPEVTGPAEALVMMLAGRPAALADLSGHGLALLG